MKYLLLLTLILCGVLVAWSGEPLGKESSEVDALKTRVQKLLVENNDLKHRLSNASKSEGLTNAQLIHQQARDMGIAGLLRDGHTKEALALLEHDQPAFVEFYRTSNRFSDDDVWILHSIRDHYQKYHLKMSAEMLAALPTPYPPCNAPSASTKP